MSLTPPPLRSGSVPATQSATAGVGGRGPEQQPGAGAQPLPPHPPAGHTLATLSWAFGALAALVACGSSTPASRYPAREEGCPVKRFAGESTLVVDDLGIVSVDCIPGVRSCERQLLDAVCSKGGDVAWGLGDNAITATHRVAHAAHSQRATQGPRERGCPVQVFVDAPPMHTENIGPVTATCDGDDSKEVCLRELEDQACLLGGDVLWQVSGPTAQMGKQRMRGRAAHTK